MLFDQGVEKGVFGPSSHCMITCLIELIEINFVDRDYVNQGGSISQPFALCRGEYSLPILPNRVKR